MGAVVLADPGDGARSGSWRRLALPTLLILGWVGLFAYSAAYLTEDLPFRPSMPEASPSAEGSAGPRAARRVVMLDEPDQPAAPAEAAGQTAMAASAPPAAPQTAAAATTAANARSAPAPGPAPAAAEYVGVWGPTPEACGARSRRRGYIPATITQDRARAGRTLCLFHDLRRSGAAWVTAAECSDRGRHWSSQVRLQVDGEHLTWSSSRGTSTYIRCGRRAG
ncbi:peptidase inhibitor family I36 protein [Methylobacterium sp. NMS12]|uniref:peptidase inhibitor family I36 protein n=1 Tax=Methylobacterium sp. NMS12 TaxID=3079766 RepID=UPI003F8810F7